MKSHISKEYEEMNEKAEVIPKSDPSSSDQMNFIAAATQRYVNCVDPGELPEGGDVPVIQIEENENAEKKNLARFFRFFFDILFHQFLKGSDIIVHSIPNLKMMIPQPTTFLAGPTYGSWEEKTEEISATACGRGP